jgi:hypothetical protein
MGPRNRGDLSKGSYQSDGDKFYTSYKNLKSYLSYYEMTSTATASTTNSDPW